MTLDLTPWVVFCLGWSFGCLLRLVVERIAERNQRFEE